MKAITLALVTLLLVDYSICFSAQPEDAFKDNPIANSQAGHPTAKNDEGNLKAQSRWLAAMPTSLKPFWDDMSEASGPTIDIVKLDTALAAQFPDVNDRVLALYRWYGEGKGGWSDFPAYESIPEKLLTRYEAKDLLRAMA